MSIHTPSGEVIGFYIGGKEVLEAWNGNGLFYTALTATTNPTFGGGFRSGPGPISTSQAVVVSVTPPNAQPISYAWRKVSGDAITINQPTGQGTHFSANVGINETLSGIFVCDVTRGGVTVQTPNVTVTLTSI